MDLDTLLQPDTSAPPVSGIPGSDPAATLQSLFSQNSADIANAPAPSASPAQSFINSNINDTPTDAILRRLHGGTEEDWKKKSAWQKAGTIGQNALIALLTGKNPRDQALEEYKARQGQLSTAASEVRNEDVARQAQAALAVKNTYEQALIANKNAETERKKAHDEAFADIGRRANDIKSKIANGTYTKAQAEADLDKARALSIDENHGLAGVPALIMRMATASPDEAASIRKELLTSEAAKSLSHPMVTGSSNISVPGQDANGNPFTQRATSRQYAAPGLNFLQQLQQGVTPQGGPLGGFGTPAFNAAPQHPATTPLAPVAGHVAAPTGVPPQTPDAPGLFPPAFMTIPNFQDRAAMRKKVDAMLPGISDATMQRSNLADAVMNNTASNYQGLMGKSFEKLRSVLGSIGANEALGRPLDYSALFGKLGGSVKGAFRQSEINAADNSLGQRNFTPQNALILHAANELAQQAQVAALNGQLKGAKVSPEELTQAMADEITRYMDSIKKVSDAKGPIKAALLAQGKPQLQPVEKAIANLRARKAVQPSSPAATKEPTLDDFR